MEALSELDKLLMNEMPRDEEYYDDGEEEPPSVSVKLFSPDSPSKSRVLKSIWGACWGDEFVLGVGVGALTPPDTPCWARGADRKGVALSLCELEAADLPLEFCGNAQLEHTNCCHWGYHT